MHQRLSSPFLMRTSAVIRRAGASWSMTPAASSRSHQRRRLRSDDSVAYVQTLNAFFNADRGRLAAAAIDQPKKRLSPPHRAAPAAWHRPALPCSTRLRVGRPTKALARSCIIIIAASQKHILLIAHDCGEAPLPLGAPAHNGPVYTCHAPAASF